MEVRPFILVSIYAVILMSSEKIKSVDVSFEAL